MVLSSARIDLLQCAQEVSWTDSALDVGCEEQSGGMACTQWRAWPPIVFDSTTLAAGGPVSPFTISFLRFLFPHRIQFDHDHYWQPALPFTFLSLSLILIGHDCHRFCANLLTIVYCHDIAPPSLYIGSLRLHCDGDITHTRTLLLVHLLYCHTPAKRTLLVVAVLPPLSLILREPIDYRLLPRYRAPITLYW